MTCTGKDRLPSRWMLFGSCHWNTNLKVKNSKKLFIRWFLKSRRSDSPLNFRKAFKLSSGRMFASYWETYDRYYMILSNTFQARVPSLHWLACVWYRAHKKEMLIKASKLRWPGEVRMRSNQSSNTLFYNDATIVKHGGFTSSNQTYVT